MVCTFISNVQASGPDTHSHTQQSATTPQLTHFQADHQAPVNLRLQGVHKDLISLIWGARF